MKILWLAPEPPIPPLTGGRERARAMLTYLAGQHAVYLLTCAAPEDAPGLAALQPWLAGLTTVPYPPRTGQRAPALRKSAQAIFRGFTPDALHVQGLDLWAYLPAPPPVQLILDWHDVPCQLVDQLHTLQTNQPWLSRWRLWRQRVRLGYQERQALRQAAMVILPSLPDREALQRSHPHAEAPIVILPNGIHLADWPPATVTPEPATILFPGALNWAPNVDAAQVLVAELLPLVQRRVPDVRLILAGRLPDRAVAQLAEANTAISLISSPPDMRPYFARATVVAVPLRAGTGTRLKILQALASSRPVVSTPLGAAGLGLENGRHLTIAPLIQPFAAALIDLLTNPVRRQQISQAGRAIIPQFDWRRFLPLLDTVY